MATYVQVAVPEREVLAVYGFLAERAGANESESEEDDSADNFGETSVDWAEEHLRALRDCPLLSVQRVAQVMDELAAAPGTSVALSDLAHATGLSRAELRGAFSGLTRWIRGVWGEDDSWPFAAGSGVSKVPELATEFYYRMSPEIAQGWQALRTA